MTAAQEAHGAAYGAAKARGALLFVYRPVPNGTNRLGRNIVFAADGPRELRSTLASMPFADATLSLAHRDRFGVITWNVIGPSGTGMIMPGFVISRQLMRAQYAREIWQAAIEQVQKIEWFDAQMAAMLSFATRDPSEHAQ